ncbi:MAG TPA: FGGY-family carbohydrate kinase [Acetobacteraceae bacterium]|nr:FGGY-family carbohydrate kinase [Acetobacteraceae bacterium]
MSPPVLLALDAGTSLIKAVAFEGDGRMLGTAARRNRYIEGPGGAVEQDMLQTWEDAASALGELVASLRGRKILALAITGQGDGTWLIDEQGAPSAPAWLWLDARAEQIISALRRSEAGRIAYKHTATGLAACQQSGQLLWLARYRPELLARVATAFHCKDWLYFCLTGVRATDPSEATFTYGDWRVRDYCDETISALGLKELRRLLPPVVDGTATAHGLSGATAARLGLREGTPVVLGYVDVLCGALGGGLYGGNGVAGVSILGSTGMHMRLAADDDDVVLNTELTGYCMPFPVPGRVAQMQSNMAATLNIDWVVDLAAEALALAGAERERSAVLAALDEAVALARPGAAVFHPFISAAGERGPFTDGTARAQLLGIERSFGFADLMRAVYEGLAFAARDCYAAIGGPPAEIRLCGGAARSTSMRAILAAALDREVRVADQPESGAAGAAMIAAVQLGLYPDMSAAAAEWVLPRLGPATLPDPALVSFYDRLFPVYRDAYRATAPVWQRMHATREAWDGA